MAQGTTAAQGAQSLQFPPNGTQSQQWAQHPPQGVPQGTPVQLVSQSATALKKMSEETVSAVLADVQRK